MKFSDGLFLSKETANLEKKITKLSSQTLPTEINKIQKQLVDTVVDNPEFRETVNTLSSYTEKYGSDPDKGQIVILMKKIQSGAMNYDDVQELSSLGSRNYKFFFKEKPSLFRASPTAIVGFLITLVAIIIRWCLEGDTNLSSQVLMCAINICAIVLTTFSWPDAVQAKLLEWTGANGLPKIISDKLITPVTKNIWWVVIIFLFASIVILVIITLFVSFALGNDILSIISLSTAVLNDNIINILVVLFQWRVYYNKER